MKQKFGAKIQKWFLSFFFLIEKSRNTLNPSPSATTCEDSGGKLALLAPTTPLRPDSRLRSQTASDGLRGRIWGRGLKRPQSSDLRWPRTASEVELRSRPRTVLKWGSWSKKKWSSFKLAKITIFANLGLGWPRSSDLRLSGPPKSRSPNNFVLQSRPQKKLPSMIFWHPK